ncbi:MAG: AMIN domain-containing protein [Myxococcaceae bacterium]
MLVLLFALSASAASAAELNSLSGLSVVKTPTGAQVVVQGSKAPTFTVFRLNEPDRLVVDLSQADGEQIKGRKDGSGPVMGVVSSQFKDDRSNVSRLLVTLEKNAKYDVRADGNRVVISIDAQGDKAASAAPAAKPVDASLGEAPRAEKSEPAKVEVAVAEEKPAAAVVEKPAKVNEANSTEPGVVASRVDEKPVKNPAQKITAFKLKNGKLQVLTDGEIAKFELIELADPPRLAVDVFGVKAAAKPKGLKGGALKEVRMGAWPDKVRLVLDVDGEMPVYSASRMPNGVSISLDKPATAAAPQKSSASAPVAMATVKQAPAKSEEADEGQAEIENRRPEGDDRHRPEARALSTERDHRRGRGERPDVRRGAPGRPGGAEARR